MRNLTFALLGLLFIAAPAVALSGTADLGLRVSHDAGDADVRGTADADDADDSSASAGADAATDQGSVDGDLGVSDVGAPGLDGVLGQLPVGLLPMDDLGLRTPRQGVELASAGEASEDGGAAEGEAGFGATLGAWLASVAAAFTGLFRPG